MLMHLLLKDGVFPAYSTSALLERKLEGDLRQDDIAISLLSRHLPLEILLHHRLQLWEWVLTTRAPHELTMHVRS